MSVPAMAFIGSLVFMFVLMATGAFIAYRHDKKNNHG